jgi:hypothetical protein
MSQLEEILHRLERKTNHLRDLGIGPIPGDLEGLGILVTYIIGFGGVVVLGSVVIVSGGYIWDQIVPKEYQTGVIWSLSKNE